jgi:glycerol-3-phosphate acyltransferase PlsX
MREEFERNVLTKLSGLVAMPVIKALRSRLDNRRYNGATLLGLRGTVIKSHGSADAYSYSQAILEGYREAVNDVPARIRKVLSEAST